MFGFTRLSETAKAVLWLWQNDPTNWLIGTHAVVHQHTGVGVWTANAAYGLHINYDIPDRDRATAHSCNGRRIELKPADRKALHKVIVLGSSDAIHRRVQQQIADWAADKIPNRVSEPVRAHG